LFLFFKIFLINNFSSDKTDPEYREYLANHHVDEDNAIPFWEYQIAEKLSNYLVIFPLLFIFIILFYDILTLVPNNLFVGYS
jgi:quinol-cytochrome oxidoreductase complex cytochrome b subunit